VPRLLKPPAGETYHADRIAEGGARLLHRERRQVAYAVSFSRAAASFCNLQALPRLVTGHLVSDVVALIGSIDIVLAKSIDEGPAMMQTYLVPLLKILVLLNAVLVSVTFMTLLERKVIAWVQVRLGPMRVGPYGSLQPIADASSCCSRKTSRRCGPTGSCSRSRPSCRWCRRSSRSPSFPSIARPRCSATGCRCDRRRQRRLLYLVSITSIGVYGIILAGYASNSKFPLLAGLRASAQLISYEIAITMMLVSIVVDAGTLSMVGIVDAQYNARVWYIFVQPVAFVILFIGGLAETNRAPFDLPEAEQELTGGYHTEYSGMRFALFFLAEYANMIVVSAVATTLFLGGGCGRFRTSRRSGSWTTFRAGRGSW
jgi:NADH-quinone oxidoreductase subunit H